jgi:hypothetical protein
MNEQVAGTQWPLALTTVPPLITQFARVDPIEIVRKRRNGGVGIILSGHPHRIVPLPSD